MRNYNNKIILEKCKNLGRKMSTNLTKYELLYINKNKIILLKDSLYFWCFYNLACLEDELNIVFNYLENDDFKYIKEFELYRYTCKDILQVIFETIERMENKGYRLIYTLKDGEYSILKFLNNKNKEMFVHIGIDYKTKNYILTFKK